MIDGHCILCNRLADWIDHRIKPDRLQVAALQESDLSEDINSQDSVVLLKGEQILIKSDAILELAGLLRFPWNGLRVFQIVPQFLRDWIYDFVASKRYGWFGKKEECRVGGYRNLKILSSK